MTLNQEICRCGHSGVINPVWHGWKVNWQNIKNKQSPESREIIKHQHVCADCKTKVKNEIQALM